MGEIPQTPHSLTTALGKRRRRSMALPLSKSRQMALYFITVWCGNSTIRTTKRMQVLIFVIPNMKMAAGDCEPNAFIF